MMIKNGVVRGPVLFPWHRRHADVGIAPNHDPSDFVHRRQVLAGRGNIPFDGTQTAVSGNLPNANSRIPANRFLHQ